MFWGNTASNPDTQLCNLSPILPPCDKEIASEQEPNNRDDHKDCPDEISAKCGRGQRTNSREREGQEEDGEIQTAKLLLVRSTADWWAELLREDYDLEEQQGRLVSALELPSVALAEEHRARMFDAAVAARYDA